MYCILMDKTTNSFYMLPNRMYFYVFSGPEKYTTRDPNAMLIETSHSDLKEITTKLYNAGFTAGYVDDDEVRITKSDAYYYDKNTNEIAYAQYLLTKDPKYLRYIKKRLLVTICKIENGKAYFPTVPNPDGDLAVLTYTDRNRIPQKLFDTYPDYRVVRMSFNTACLVNGNFFTE